MSVKLSGANQWVCNNQKRNSFQISAEGNVRNVQSLVGLTAEVACAETRQEFFRNGGQQRLHLDLEPESHELHIIKISRREAFSGKFCKQGCEVALRWVFYLQQKETYFSKKAVLWIYIYICIFFYYYYLCPYGLLYLCLHWSGEFSNQKSQVFLSEVQIWSSNTINRFRQTLSSLWYLQMTRK